MDPNWPRWVFASVADFLKSVATANSLPSLVDGSEDRSDAFANASDRVEIRITGPYTQQLSSNYYLLTVDANVLLQCRYETKNGYQRQTLMGPFYEAMAGPIPVYKFGPEAGDDKSQIGCLKLPRGGQVKLHHFGQLTHPERISESICDARYVMDLTA